MEKIVLKKASEVKEIYDLRTKYYFVCYIDLCPSQWIHSDIDYYFDTPECKYKRDDLHRRLEKSLEDSRSWPKRIHVENLKVLHRYLKGVQLYTNYNM